VAGEGEYVASVAQIQNMLGYARDGIAVGATRYYCQLAGPFCSGARRYMTRHDQVRPTGVLQDS